MNDFYERLTFTDISFLRSLRISPGDPELASPEAVQRLLAHVLEIVQDVIED